MTSIIDSDVQKLKNDPLWKHILNTVITKHVK